MENQFFRQMEERPTYRIDQELETRGIGYRICRYSDCQGPGWRQVTLDKVELNSVDDADFVMPEKAPAQP